MDSSALGKIYEDGEIIFRQGETGDYMIVIQEGKVEIVVEETGAEKILAVRGAGDFIGEMALFEREKRMATARALGRIRVLSIDKKNILRRLHDDPSLAYRLIQIMSMRIRELSIEVARMQEWLLSLSNPSDNKTLD
jgi:CRP-like cAMP-binding protein